MRAIGNLCRFLAGLGALGLSSVLPAQAEPDRPLLQDSFRIGSGGGALCQAQSVNGDPANRTMFDRAWAVVCRDAARPVGRIYALRRKEVGDEQALLERLAASRRSSVNCSAPGGMTLPDIGAATVRNCSSQSGTYRISYPGTPSNPGNGC